MCYSILSKYRTELMGVAILWVMLFHSFDLNMGLTLLEWVRAAGFGGVDIFILLSSMGLVMSLARREQSYSAFMARRAGRVLPAYYLVMVPYTLFQVLTRGAPLSALLWNAALLYYWVRPAGAFNWYVAGSMSFYAITPFCFRRLRASRRRECLTAAGVLLGLVIGRVLMVDGYWYSMDLVFRLPIFCLGLLLGFYVLEDRRLGTRDILFWCVWLGLGVLYLLTMGKGPNADYRPLCYLFLFTTVPMCFAICWCFERFPLGWAQRFFRLLGRHSLEIYLLNVSLFSEVTLLRRFVSFGPSNRLYFLLSYAANIALAVALHRLVELWKKHGRQPRLPPQTTVAKFRGILYNRQENCCRQGGLSMLLNVLAVGDVVGEGGQDILSRRLPGLREETGAHFCVVNGENASGVGITPAQARRVLEAGADVITLGNHTWNRIQIGAFLDKEDRILRPANYAGRVPGRGFGVYRCQGLALGVLNIMGRVDLNSNLDSPFKAANYFWNRGGFDLLLVDFHAEATSEKGAMGWHLDGRAAAVWGTHTHVPTADCRVLPQGTGFVTDLGMTGPVNSVLGIKPENSLNLFLGGLPRRYEEAEGNCKLNACLFTIDTETKKCVNVVRTDIIE